jgi:hypothetical protein
MHLIHNINAQTDVLHLKNNRESALATPKELNGHLSPPDELICSAPLCESVPATVGSLLFIEGLHSGGKQGMTKTDLQRDIF